MAFRVCPSCGYVIIDPSQSCVSCGAMPGPEIPPAVKAPAAQPPVAPPPAAEPFPVTPAAAYVPPRAKLKKRGRGKFSRIMKAAVFVVLLAAAACAALVMLPASDKPVSVAWERRFGGSSYDTATSAQQTADGGHVFAGVTRSNDGDISGRHANQEAYYVVKLDASDGIEWQRLLDSSASGHQIDPSVQQTGDGGYILAGKDVSDSYGDFRSVDVWVVKLNPVGNIEWQRYFGGSKHEEAYSISQTKDGGYIFSGRTDSRDGDVSGNQGDGGSGDDAWIVKLSADGDIEWQRRLGGSGTEVAYSVLQTDGGYIAAVSTDSNDGDAPGNHGGYDALIVKLNEDGGTEWQRRFGGSGNDFVSSIQPTKDGGYIAAGNTASGDGDLADSPGGQGAWIFKMNAAGNAEWHKRLAAPPDNSYAMEIKQTGGGYIVVGYTITPSGNVRSPRAWIVNLSESGDVGWQKYLSDTSSDWRHIVLSAEPTGDGGFIISGQTSPSFTDTDEIDAWVARLMPDDNPDSAANEGVPFPGEDDDAPASSQNPLLGTWRTTFQGSESEMTYRSDGTFSERTGGITAEGTYSVEGNRLTTVTPGLGRNVSTFEIKGDVLTEKPVHVEVNGQDVTSAMQGMTITSTRVR